MWVEPTKPDLPEPSCEITIVDDIWSCHDVPLNPSQLASCKTELKDGNKCKSCRTLFPTEDWYLVRAAKNNGHFFYDQVERQKPDKTWEVFDTRRCR